MATEIWVNISLGNGLLPGGTKPLPEPMLTDHQRSPGTFIHVLGQFHKRCLNYQSIKSVWNYIAKISFKFPRGQCVIQFKYGLPYCVNCPSMSMDPRSLNQGMRWSRVKFLSTHNRHPIAHPWGPAMGYCWESDLWSTFFIAICDPALIWQHYHWDLIIWCENGSLSSTRKDFNYMHHLLL